MFKIMKLFSYARAVEADTAVATISNNQDTELLLKIKDYGDLSYSFRHNSR